MCIKCDEFHNLVVDLGSLRGLIPREETALGIADGAREIAILSRVGKPVCFQVLGFTSDGTVLLSRRAAQAEALDYFLEHLRPGDILPSVVQNPASFGTFCDIGCGVTALMSIERCSVSPDHPLQPAVFPRPEDLHRHLGDRPGGQADQPDPSGSSWVPGPRMPPDSEPDRPSPASYGAFSPMAHS